MKLFGHTNNIHKLITEICGSQGDTGRWSKFVSGDSKKVIELMKAYVGMLKLLQADPTFAKAWADDRLIPGKHAGKQKVVKNHLADGADGEAAAKEAEKWIQVIESSSAGYDPSDDSISAHYQGQGAMAKKDVQGYINLISSL